MRSDNKLIRWRRCCAAAAAAATSAVIIVIIQLHLHFKRTRRVPREPTARRDMFRNIHMRRILQGTSGSCLDYLRMRKGPFLKLAKIMRENGLLKDSINVPIEEQLAMFLHILGHKSQNRVVRIDFIRSGETISRYFNKVLGAICCLRDHFMKPASNVTPPEIANDAMYYPFFADCIGFIDGTHIDARVPSDQVPCFRGRKGVTQNVLAAVTPDKRFTYVLAGWEGSANDFSILKDALSLPQPHGLRVYEGKYYLCDAGYTTMPGFISPYRGVRYHLKEHNGQTPNNRKELFNLRHSSLRSRIESTFGILKNRFKILSSKPHYPFTSQVDIVLACTVLHNYIAVTDPHDQFLNEEMEVIEEDGDLCDEDDNSILDFSESMTVQEQIDAIDEWKLRRDQIAWDMWVDYCTKYHKGNTTETEM